MKYTVKLIFRFTEIVTVEADSEREAKELAITESEGPEYECWEDSQILPVGNKGE